MSAPVPLSSGCCSPPCPSNPQTAVPGPAGENAFSFTTSSFTQPGVGSNVTIALTHDGWVAQNQILFISGGGFYQVVSVSGLTITITNLGGSANSISGTVINSGAQVSPGGQPGTGGNAFTLTTSNYTQPAVSAQVNVSVISSVWAAVGQRVFVATGGYYTIFSLPDATHINLTNDGDPVNAAPAAVIISPQQVSPAGLRGAAGASGVSTLNSVSPTTTKGDLIVDNGANNPLASDVRFPVGTNGQILAADSTQATGLHWQSTIPTTVATSGDIAVFNGTSGSPTPLQDSKMLISSTGALQSTPSGGNARGTSAIDLQVVRGANTQVASGARSVVLGGENNTASAADSTVAGGIGNTASGANSTTGGGTGNTASNGSATVSGGNGNNASGLSSFIGGGDNNIASNADTVVAGGSGNTASGIDSSVLGGVNNSASAFASSVLTGSKAIAYLWGQVAHNNGFFAAAGDSQTSELMWRILTTDATAGVEAFLDGAAARAVVPLNTTWAFEIYTIARSSAGVCAMFKTEGAIQNNANTVSLVAAVVQSVVADGTGSTWGVTANHAITADNTNKSLKVAVTGAVATNIRWTTRARLVEISF